MFLQNKMKRSTRDYWDKIRKAAEIIKTADRMVIGIGSGVTAAGGLFYADPALAEKWYPEYVKMGKHSISDIMSLFWPTALNEQNATAFWGFWAKHIYHIRYEAEALKPYQDLMGVIGNKEFFICSTNVDGQLEKVGFDKDRIFAPQGDYALLQCKKSCTQEVYPNRKMIDIMLTHMVSAFEVRKSDIPRCPNCGGYLVPNLRCDSNFVEEPHIQNMAQYKQFLASGQNKKIILLELGVGFNTPGIIRLPFEIQTARLANAHLIRVNREYADVPNSILGKSVSLQEDVGKVLGDIKSL